MLNPWEDRPFEIANNFNPAFCSLLLHDAIVSYELLFNEGMDYPLVFIILPIILHKETREKLPKSIRKKMHSWLEENPELKINFNTRTKNLISITKEALLFSFQNDVLAWDKNGKIITKGTSFLTHSFPKQSIPDLCRQKSKLLGRWLASTGETKTIFVIWGIRP